jgi:hypothetical protein
MVKMEKNEILQTILKIFLIVLGIILIYQLIKKILGGSWDIEPLILTLVVVNLGHAFYFSNKLAKMETRRAVLINSFTHLSTDFKEHIKHK